LARVRKHKIYRTTFAKEHESMTENGRARILVVLACMFLAEAPPRTVAQETIAARIAFHKLQQDLLISDILSDLKESAPKGPVIFHDVRLVNANSGIVTASHSVLVRGRSIEWTGAIADEPKIEGATTIDARGDFLAPGLTDMHVHTNNMGDFLLDLSAGVTAVRDMAGFPWMLKARDAIDNDRMLAPTLYVAGPLINAFPLQGYAVVPRDAADARRIVRQEAACGYDFIKIWNILPEPIFDAIAEQAKALDMDLIGHVPQGIPVRHAVELGMRTMEHLKGFLNDATLSLGDTDYAAAIDGRQVWSTPTLYKNVAPPRGAEGRKRLAAPEMRFVPLRMREAWAKDVDRPDERATKELRESRPIQFAIMAKLHAEHARFLAGTDSANSSFQVRGYALLDELEMLLSAGLTPLEVLQSATSEPPRAMRIIGAVGEIRAGERADLVLLKADPTKDPSAYRQNHGVMAHGFWIPRQSLDSALDRLAAAYAENDGTVAINHASVSALLAHITRHLNAGIIFNAKAVLGAADAVREVGFTDFAEQLKRLAYVPSAGACADERAR
jgi:imidazolonepropionase-like amidohydrolase